LFLVMFVAWILFFAERPTFASASTRERVNP
jgi:hypothetical protein